MATFPNAIFSWTNRINDTDVVWAADPNSMAAEILAIENNIGAKAQIESGVPVGNPVTYKNVSSRITGAMNGTNLPYVSLYNTQFNVGYGTAADANAVYFNFKKLQDTYGYFNGSDITVKASGVYAVDSYTAFQWYNQGFCASYLIINGVVNSSDYWKWNFAARGKGAYTDDRFGVVQWSWLGTLNKGDRVRVGFENGTTRSSYRIENTSLKMQYIRSNSLGGAPGTGQAG